MKNIFLICLAVLLLFASCNKGGETNPSSLVSAENALESYLENGDETFSWELKNTYELGNAKVYVLQLVSQQWREHTWVHQLNVIVPPELSYDGALLFISGGSAKNGRPEWRPESDPFTLFSSLIAAKNKAITAVLWQTPNQPLYDNLTEDALISFTLHNFRMDKDYSWPLLFPMVKSAKRAMDAVQEFSQTSLNMDVGRFVVSGASKRGWTSWLTAAVDTRVEAVAPMVIDVLNMPVNLNYQLEVWKDFSVQIEDYVKLGIVDEIGTGTGAELTQMIDPFSYRSKLTMPKLIIIGTNDEYWPVDAVKHYIDEIPGENYIHYVPNAGHDLDGGEQAIVALSAFFGRTLKKEPYPVLDWNLSYNEEKIRLSVTADPDQLEAASLWSADSEDRDFRDEKFVKKNLNVRQIAAVETIIAYPANGFRAFYIDLTYTDPNGGNYTKSTRMFVADEDEVL